MRLARYHSVGHRAGRPAVVAGRADRIVFGRQQISGRAGGDRLAAVDERGRRVAVGRFRRRIVAEPAREAEALRLDRLGSRPRAKPARFGADRERLPPHIERQCRRDRRGAGERPHRPSAFGSPRVAKKAAAEPSTPVTISATMEATFQRSALRLERTRPLRPSPVFVPGLLDHRSARARASLREPLPDGLAGPRRQSTRSLNRRRRAGSSRRLQRLVEVGEDVVDVLDADRQAHVAVRDAGRELLFRRRAASGWSWPDGWRASARRRCWRRDRGASARR